MTRRVPVGVCSFITPFNFPLNLVAHKIACGVFHSSIVNANADCVALSTSKPSFFSHAATIWRLAALERHVAETGDVLTEAQVIALERKQDDDVAHGEIETAHPGYLGSQDTFYVGTLKGVGRIYQQTFIDTYAKVAFAKLYDRKTALTAAELLNDRVIPFFDEHGLRIDRVLTAKGSAEACDGVRREVVELCKQFPMPH